MIKTTDTDLTVRASKVMVVEIGHIRFEWEADYPWITVLSKGDEQNIFLYEIDEDDITCSFGSLEDYKLFCLNWFFKNVEIVKREDKDYEPKLEKW